MDQPLTADQKKYRMNIRNFYLTASVEELDKEIEYRKRNRDFPAVRYLEELRNETVAERFVNRGKELADLARKEN